MKKWQIENSETSEILFRFLISEFSIFLFPRNSDLKISEKNFWVFDLACENIWKRWKTAKK